MREEGGGNQSKILRERKEIFCLFLLLQFLLCTGPHSTGQTELQGRLDDDKTRLDNLKRSFSDRLSLLSSLSKNLTTFTGIANALLPWLQEQASVGEGLILKEPSYKLIQEKLATCQV